MPLDPQIKVILDQIDALGLPPHYEVGAVQARANAASRPRAQGPEVTSVENRSIAGPDGQVPIRIYKPAGSGPFPAIVWAHGGGMVIGTLETCDYICRKLCVNVGCVVVSVDYRLAPEHTFPAAPHDFYEATKWVADNAGELGVDVGRISVGGESAGANLAAAVALMARDLSGPSLVHQTLINPMLDTNFDTASYLENAEGYFLTRKTMMWYWEQYLGKPDGTNEPYAAPLLAPDVSGLPPALLIVGEFDPLRDETEAYAARLQAAGVATTCTRYDGGVHNFFSMPATVDKATQAVAQMSEALKSVFAAAGVR
jgi:acetyl esterase